MQPFNATLNLPRRVIAAIAQDSKISPARRIGLDALAGDPGGFAKFA